MKNRSKINKTAINNNHVENKAQQIAHGIDLWGEVISWKPGDGNVTHTQILNALAANSMDAKAERELTFETAFGRAAKKLEREGVMIDETKDHGDEVVFQVTTRTKLVNEDGDEEWKFKKKAYLRLHKTTGVVTSKDAELAIRTKEALDTAKEARTGGDVTFVVQRLLDAQAGMDLMPIREQGGAYFVAITYQAFLQQLDGFLRQVGGRIKRFPIPKGTQQGDAAVQESVADYLAGLLADMETAVSGFTSHTRVDTIEGAAVRISDAKVKVEAYAQYLGDKQSELLAAVDAANAKLVEQIEKLTSEIESEKEEEAQGAIDTDVPAEEEVSAEEPVPF